MFDITENLSQLKLKNKKHNTCNFQIGKITKAKKSVEKYQYCRFKAVCFPLSIEYSNPQLWLDYYGPQKKYKMKVLLHFVSL